MSKSLAIKYRPKTWDDVTEQGSVKTILQNQINTNTIKNAYLFCGGAGTGKTTCARIFANEINHGVGVPIELDAASNNGVDDIRELCEQAQTKSLDSEYKVFIVDEAHMITVQGWNAFLKTLEEPPEKSIFIFATTDPQKIPNTILSRVQRYNFQRISQQGIVNRLEKILEFEYGRKAFLIEPIEYIAKVADGGMRDAITLMDKCLSFSEDLTLDNVIEALGLADYSTMQNLTTEVFNKNVPAIINILNTVHSSGKDIKLFIKEYFKYILDVSMYNITRDSSLTKLPESCISDIDTYGDYEVSSIKALLKFLTPLVAEIKWEQDAKAVVVAKFILFIGEQ
jgi:DNA polymerase-3 subunit gamma/tau